MKEILTRNLGLKILSVVIAFFIWLAVVNVSNPLDTRSREIPLEIQNANVLEKAGLAYELDTKKSTVTVTYEIHHMDQASVSVADFRAYINLADYYPATGTVPISVEVLNGKDYLLESVSVRPGVIRVKTEQIQQKDFDLRVNKLGTAADNYEVDKVVLNPDMVTLQGPESVIGRINAVGVEVDIEGIKGETVGTAVPVFYDANGNKITLDDRVSINIDEIAYTIYVVKTKVMPLEFTVSGQPAEGFRYVGMETSANSVSVIGVESIIAGIPSIQIPASVLNMDGADRNQVITIDVEDYLPDKENISIPWNSQVTVTLKVEKLEQKTLEVPTNRIIEEGENGDYLYEYSDDSIDLTLEGLKADLEGIEASELIVEMDVSQMNPGIHPGVLTVEGLENITLVRHSDFQVTVSLKESGTRAESESTEEEEENMPVGSSQVKPSHGEEETAETVQDGIHSTDTQAEESESPSEQETSVHGEETTAGETGELQQRDGIEPSSEGGTEW